MVGGRRSLIVGVLLWAALVYGGRVWGEPVGPDLARLPVAARLLSSAVLVLSALIAWRTMRDSALRVLAGGVLVGMALDAVGDVMLSGALPLPPVAGLAAGLGIFGLGHLAYLAGMGDLARNRAGAWRIVLSAGVFVAAGAAGWYHVVYGAAPAPLLGGGALAYTLLLASMVGVAVALGFADYALLPLAVGAVLFFVSDLVLSLQLFRPAWFASLPDAWRGDLVWLLYGTGQMLIVHAAPIAEALGETRERPRRAPLRMQETMQET